MNKIRTGHLLIVLSFVACLPGKAYAQDTAKADTLWKTGGKFNFNFSQVGLYNWAGGGASSISLTGISNLYARYDNGRSSWENSLDMAYGIVRQGDDNPFKKSDDKLILHSSYGRTLSKHWALNAMLNWRTQFRPGYVYPEEGGRQLMSDFMAPGYLQNGIGVEYRLKKTFTAAVSPLTGKYTFMWNDRLAEAGAFGVEPGQKFRAEIGASATLTFKKELMTNITLDTRLSSFLNYQRPKHIDVNGELLLTMKVNAYVTSSISAQLIYDDDVDVLREDGSTGPATQFKETINVGFFFDF